MKPLESSRMQCHLCQPCMLPVQECQLTLQISQIPPSPAKLSHNNAEAPLCGLGDALLSGMGVLQPSLA